MSIRYGIELVFDPVFTAGVYRLRQFVCGQFGCWAAEMHMLRMQVVPYFECPEEGLPLLDQEVAQVASGSRSRSPGPEVGWNGISEDKESGSVLLDISEVNGTLTGLYHSAIDAVSRVPGSQVPDFAKNFTPRIALLEYGGLSPAILADAAECARGAASALTLPVTVKAWRLLIVQYSSQAAGDDWSHGRWANDVGWKQLFSYAL